MTKEPRQLTLEGVHVPPGWKWPDYADDVNTDNMAKLVWLIQESLAVFDVQEAKKLLNWLKIELLIEE